MPSAFLTHLTIYENGAEFYPGEKLSGSVLFIARRPVNVRGLKVVVKGKVKIDAPDKWWGGSHKISVFDETLVSHKNRQLRQGENILHFHKTLPDDLPPSMEVTGLRLTYKVSVTYSKFLGRGRLARKVIKVKPLLNLCRPPVIPAYEQGMSRLEWVHQGSDFVFARIDLDSCSFATDDKILARFTIMNESRRVSVTAAICHLARVITYEHQGKVSTLPTDTVVDGGQACGVLPPGRTHESCVTMVLENCDLPSTGLLGRTDIHIDYKIKLVVIPEEQGFPILTMEVPIIVGTRPAEPDPPGATSMDHDSGPQGLNIVNPSSLGATSASFSDSVSHSPRAQLSASSDCARLSRFPPSHSQRDHILEQNRRHLTSECSTDGDGTTDRHPRNPSTPKTRAKETQRLRDTAETNVHRNMTPPNARTREGRNQREAAENDPLLGPSPTNQKARDKHYQYTRSQSASHGLVPSPTDRDNRHRRQSQSGSRRSDFNITLANQRAQDSGHEEQGQSADDDLIFDPSLTDPKAPHNRGQVQSQPANKNLDSKFTLTNQRMQENVREGGGCHPSFESTQSGSSRDSSLTNVKLRQDAYQELSTGGAHSTEGENFEHQAQFESDTQCLQTKRTKRPRNDS